MSSILTQIEVSYTYKQLCASTKKKKHVKIDKNLTFSWNHEHKMFTETEKKAT